MMKNLKKKGNIIAITTIAIGSIAGITSTNVQASPLHASKISQCGNNAKIITPTKSTTLNELGISNNSKQKTLYEESINNPKIKWVNSGCTIIKEKAGTAFSHSHNNHTQNVKTTNSKYTASTLYYTNWSGYEAINPASNFVNAVKGTWREPNAKNTDYKNGSQIVTWAGIGAGNSKKDPLIQGGTSTTSNTRGTIHQFFLEVYPNESMQIINNIPLKANDQVSVEITWNKGTATFLECNNTQNKCVLGQEKNIVQPVRTAEWIVETPSIGYNNQSASLANYGTINFSNTNWNKTNSGSWVHSLKYWANPVIMLGQSTNKVISTPGSVLPNGNSFNVYYKGSR